MSTFEEHDHFIFNPVDYTTRNIFKEHVRKTYDQVRELADYIEQYEGTIDSEFTAIVDHVNEQVTQLTDLYNDLLDNNVLDSAIQDKLTQLEQDYTPKINDLNTQLAQTVAHTKGKINIMEYEHLKVDNDWTNAINEAISSLTKGGTITFPEGTFEHTGFTVPAKYLNFEGAGRYATFLKNVSNNNAITLADSSERGSFKNIAIIGNGTVIHGSNATSGHGIVFSRHSVSWNFENVTVRGHGGDGFHGGTIGHVNNINIINSEIEFNKGSGIHFVATAGLSQINAINVQGCNIAYNGGSGFELWGNNINISGNTIQANKEHGYNISSDLVTGSGTVYCDAIKIEGNYSEQNYLELLNIKVDTNRVIGLINFEKNYGKENHVDESVTSIVKISKSDEVSFFIRPLRRFNFFENSVTGEGLNVIDGGNVLHGSSEIQTDGTQSLSRFVNLGYAQFITKRKLKVLNNYFDGKGLTFELDGKSENITSHKTIMYPLKQENYKGIHMFGVPLDTDYVSPRVDLVVYGRKEGSIGNYEIIQTLIATTITDGVISKTSDTFSPFGENIDLYIEIKVYPGSTGTFLYMYNPFIQFA